MSLYAVFWNQIALIIILNKTGIRLLKTTIAIQAKVWALILQQYKKVVLQTIDKKSRYYWKL